MKSSKRRREREILEIELKNKKKEVEKLTEKIKKIEEQSDENLEKLGGQTEVVDRLDDILDRIEASSIDEYVHLMNNKPKLIRINLLVGISRGLGTAIGLTFLAAVLIYLARQLVEMNIPIIGRIITDIVEIVQENLNK